MYPLHWVSALITALTTVTLFVLNTIQRTLADYRQISARTSSSALEEIIKQSKQPIIEGSTVDLTQTQLEMEQLFHKNQLHDRLRREFEELFAPAIPELVEAGLPVSFVYDLLVQMHLHKRAKTPVLVGILRRHFKGDCQATANALAKSAELDLVNFDLITDDFIVIYTVSADVQREVDLYQYPMPMIVEPRELTSNRSSGYLTHNYESVILKNNHHEDDVCLDALNRFNKTKLKINSDVVAFLKNSWKNLDKRKEGETHQEFLKRGQAFKRYDKNSRDIIAHLEVTGGECYLTHRYDKRGRVYSQGYHVNYQGNDWNKAVIQFANGEPL